MFGRVLNTPLVSTAPFLLSMCTVGWLEELFSQISNQISHFDNTLNTRVFTHLPCYATILTNDYQYKVKDKKNLSIKIDQWLWKEKHVQHHFNLTLSNIGNLLKLTKKSTGWLF